MLRRIGAVAYKLQLPDHAKIHPVFHVSQLKPFRGAAAEAYIPLPLHTSELGQILWPTAVLDSRTIVQGSTLVPQVLIQWEGCSPAEATWEVAAELQASYPHFNLADKVHFKGDGNVIGVPPGNAHDMVDLTTKREIPELVTTNQKHVGLRRGNRKKIANRRFRDYV